MGWNVAKKRWYALSISKNLGFHSYLYTKVSPDILIKAFFIPKMKAAYVTIIQSLM